MSHVRFAKFAGKVLISSFCGSAKQLMKYRMLICPLYREAGAVEALVKLLEGAEDAFVAKGALGAISSLVQGNPNNKLAVREANGIEVRKPVQL